MYAARTWCSWHRARRLHYDLRFEIDGVLVSWAVPKGPTLDPSTRHWRYTSRTTRWSTPTSRASSPAGEYGGGDVIVWDRGSWEPHDTDDPAAAVAAGELHADMHGEKLRGRLVLVRRERSRPAMTATRSGCFCTSTTGSPSTAGTPRTTRSRCCRVAPTKRSPPTRTGSGTPTGRPPTPPTVVRLETRCWRRARRPRTTSRPAVGSGTFSAALKVTNLDKELFPPRARAKPVTKRDLLRYAAEMAPTVLPYVTGRALNMHRYPDGADRKGFWHKAAARARPGVGGGLGQPGRRTRRDRDLRRCRRARDAGVGGQLRRAGVAPLDLAHRCAGPPDVRDARHRPRASDTPWDDVLVLARLHRTALEHLGVRAQLKVTGRRGIQIWVPIARGPTFTRLAPGSSSSRDDRQGGPGTGQLEVGGHRRGGRARLDYTQNAVNKTTGSTVLTPAGTRRACLVVPIAWHELDDPELRPDRWTVRTVLDRLDGVGDPFRALLGVDPGAPRAVSASPIGLYC